ncbi:hypothetical protein CIPAW_07G024600 [Carya illinoinensis]|uniref:Uncharacterized protein n=1 Tax=Carya illinoinensis TaxID=32201 RepID=A0A8T1PXV7_CARIL|nr:hypothetical protein CIPAW_07G024600 [Carya illinoinensis]
MSYEIVVECSCRLDQHLRRHSGLRPMASILMYCVHLRIIDSVIAKSNFIKTTVVKVPLTNHKKKPART